MLTYSSEKIHTGPIRQIVKSTKRYDIAKLKNFKIAKTAKNSQNRESLKILEIFKNSARSNWIYTSYFCNNIIIYPIN